MKKLWTWVTGLIHNSSFLRFAIVGVINTLVGSGTMFLLYNCIPWATPADSTLPYWISTAANYVVGSVVRFFLNKYFTFRSRSWSWSQVWKFALNIAVCYGVAYGLAKPLVRLALSGADKQAQENLAMLVGMVLFVCLNYFGQRFFAFRVKMEDAGQSDESPR